VSLAGAVLSATTVIGLAPSHPSKVDRQADGLLARPAAPSFRYLMKPARGRG